VYESDVTTLGECINVVTGLSSGWSHRRFVWRGVGDASYALHSSLYRGVAHAGVADEASVRDAEDAVVAEAQRWSLQRTPTDRLSFLELLAALQHQGAPTRLLDFSHNALVALWFAVEQKFHPDGSSRPDTDGRVFVAQSNNREIPVGWERSHDVPWVDPPDDWSRNIYVWTPPPIDGRIARQQGCFVFGGVPSTAGGWNRSPAGGGLLQRDDVRRCVSVPIRLNASSQLSGPGRGRPPTYPLAFTFRIPAGAKPLLRAELLHGFGYDHAMLYPDLPGFVRLAASVRGLRH
jgi:hypothetical protein